MPGQRRFRRMQGSFVLTQPLQFTLRQLRDTYSRPRNLTVLAIVAVVLGLAGPFGTYADFGLGPRIAYWAAIVFATYGIGLGATLLASQVLERSVRHVLARVTIAGALGGLPVTLAVLGINVLAYGVRETLPPLPLLAYCCAISAGVALALSLFAPGLVGAPPQGAPASATGQGASTSDALEARPTILDRLPLARRGTLLALSVNDHYVDVVTDRGTSLVLMRLGDAIREAEGVAGLQIHRSHWVALGAVTASIRENGRVHVELSNGQRLPVSRGALAAARAAGLLR
jgi:hypothetical protein